MGGRYRTEATYAATRLPVELASTLLPAAYHDPEYHAAELEALWRRSWVCVGLVDEVAGAGDVIVRTVGGRSVAITRDHERRLHAFHNVCRHRGSQLVTQDQTLKAGRFRCPYHAWAYALDGACLGTPLFDGSDIPAAQRVMFDMSDVKAFDKADYGLLPVRVDTWGPLLFVNLDLDAITLDHWLGDLDGRFANYDLADWTSRSAKTYEIEANWKLIAENFMEYYHLPWVHPELVKVSRMEDHYRYQGPGMYTGMMTNPVSQADDPAWLSLPPYPQLSDDELVSGRFMGLFPNVALSVLPNHVFVMLLTPTAARHTSEETHILIPPSTDMTEQAATALEKLAGFWDHVNQEDIEVVERVQTGISMTDYTGGRMCYRFEEPLHRFQNMVIDRMVGVDRIPTGDGDGDAPVFVTG
ncbi:MAG TPA: SRPBCC family protein [Acidimicrobiia bacterium]|jgi:choline monooxygenase|nr:SRPBCC family protein [Acidimicrobiia bacterium]